MDSLLDQVQHSVILLDDNEIVCNLNVYATQNFCPRSMAMNKKFSANFLDTRFVADFQKTFKKCKLQKSMEQIQAMVILVDATEKFPQSQDVLIKMMYMGRLNTAVALYITPNLSDLGNKSIHDVSDFIDNAPIALQWISGTGHILWCNQTMLSLLNYTAPELIGKHLTEVTTDSEQMLSDNLKSLENGGVLKDHHSIWLTKEGEKRHILLDSSLNMNSDGTVRNSRCFVRDDTANQLNELRASIQRQEQDFRLQSQDRFLRKTLHEIVTPIHTIMNAESMDLVKRQCSKLLRIIKDVQMAEQFEGGKIPNLVYTEFDIRQVVADLCTSIFEEYENVQVSTSIVFQTCIPDVVKYELSCFKKIVSHLVENAFKFTKQGKIEIAVDMITDDASKLSVEIRNTHAELDANLLHKVCQRYYDNTSGSYFGYGEGIGLGLNIAYNLCAALSTELTMMYDHSSASVVFRFELVQADGDDINHAVNTRRSTSTIQWLDVEESMAAKQHIILKAGPERPLPPMSQCELGRQIAKRICVLVVDDNRICRMVLSKALAKLNCLVHEASQGQEAVDKARLVQYDLTILDVRMPPGFSGDVAAKFILQDNNKQRIVGLTADSTSEVEKQCMDAGMLQVMHKPASFEQVRKILEKYTSGK